MLVANAGAVFASPLPDPYGGWMRRLDRQGAGCPQQSGQRQQQRGGAARGRALARVGAAAARFLTPQLLAQDARVRGGAQAAHVVVARPSVLAVQEFVVADIRCRTREGGAGRRSRINLSSSATSCFQLKKNLYRSCAPPSPPQTKHDSNFQTNVVCCLCFDHINSFHIDFCCNLGYYHCPFQAIKYKAM